MANYTPRVSIIIPVYNGTAFVAEAIQSALAQTYQDFEIIVADDGSIDDIEKVLQPYSQKIIYLRFSHRGISATRNAAILQSHGEFIALLDSDDLWEPEKLALQIAYLDAHPEFALVYSYSTNFTDDSEGNVALVRRLDFEGFIFKDLFTINSFANSTIIMRRNVFDEVNGYDESLSAMEDYDLNLRIGRDHQIGRVPQALLRRRIHPGSFYSSGYDNQYIFQLPVYEKFMSDSTVAQKIGQSKEEYLSSFILKFIFKNLYDKRLEFIEQKLQDLKHYSEIKVQLAQQLVKTHNLSEAAWRPLIPEFGVWQAEVIHKAILYKERRSHNFNKGAGRLTTNHQ